MWRRTRVVVIKELVSVKKGDSQEDICQPGQPVIVELASCSRKAKWLFMWQGRLFDFTFAVVHSAP